MPDAGTELIGPLGPREPELRTSSMASALADLAESIQALPAEAGSATAAAAGGQTVADAGPSVEVDKIPNLQFLVRISLELLLQGQL